MPSTIIQANGLNFNVLVEGQGAPVLLLHGFPDSLKLWRHVIPQLVQAGYKVIAYDQRGYGESDAPSEVSAYRVESIIADAVAILKSLGYSSGVKLVGHDWGAVIGWLLCIQHPELIEKYVAVSVGHPLAYRHAGWEQKRKGWYVLAFQIPGYPEKRIAGNNWAAIYKMTGKASEAENWIKDLSRPGRLSAAINWYRANFSRLLFGKPGKNKVPTLGVYSSGDLALTEKQMTDSANYMDATWQYARIEGSSHWIPLDKPDELVQSIIPWFSQPV